MAFFKLHHLSCSLILLFYLGSVALSLSSTDVALLLEKIKPALQGHRFIDDENLVLSSWNISVPLCQWRGLTWVFSGGLPLACTDLSSPQSTNISLYKDPSLHLQALLLPSANLTGWLPRELGEFSMLQSLYLNINFLNGPIPLELGYSSSLSDVDLSSNLLNGTVAPSLWNLCGVLVSLRLNGNSLSGTVPEPGLPNTSCKKLETLDFGRNRFSGSFPMFLVNFPALKELDLSSNMLSGQVPASLSDLNLEKLNISHNNFTGVVPPFAKSKFGSAAFEGNDPSLCGLPLKTCGGSSVLSAGAIAGIVIGLMSGVVIAASLLIGYVQSKRKGREGSEDELEEEEYSGRGGEEADGKLMLFQGGEHLTLEDVLNATGQVMEKTSYGTVYKAKLSDGGIIALRLLREGTCKDRSSSMSVIRMLGKIRHENLIPLRAFYEGKRGEKLLIYDYLPHRTLHDLLHDPSAGKPVLNWAKRHKIALAIAKGLAYLHNGLDEPIVHGNMRSKNVLVDDFSIARIAEFGLDKLMIPSVGDEIVAIAKADGYKAPELQTIKKCSCRTDVYAFGILLLEILIGKKPGKDGKNGVFLDLPALVKVAVLEETTMEVFDCELLKGVRSPMEGGLVHALKLAMGCCAPVATVRPSMDEVVKQLEENRPRNRSALYSPTETRSETGTPF